MGRDYSSNAIIQLPRLSAASAIALGSAVLSGARSAALPELLHRPRAQLEGEWEALSEAAVNRLSPGERRGSLEEDRRLDVAWSGLRDVLAGFAKLPAAVERGERARALQGLLFPEGLRFTKLEHRRQWSESEVRLNRLGEEPAATLARELGVEPFVLEAKAAHERYGEALGITQVRTPARDPREVKRRLWAFSRALRCFVLHLIVVAESGEPEAAALASRLLAQVAEWPSSGR